MRGYTEHEPEPNPTWAGSIWGYKFGSNLNVQFAHLFTHLILLFAELKKQNGQRNKQQKLMKHVLLGLKRVVETA